MKIRKLFMTICLMLLFVGLFGGCAEEQVSPPAVFYSDWIDFNHSKDTFIPAPEITQAVLDKGVVLVYLGLSGTSTTTGAVHLLPLAIQLGAIPEIHHVIYVGRIALYSSTKFTLKYRYVVMPGAMPGDRKAAIDYSDYEAVKKAYNIPD